ncbi:MAG: GSU2403 family nucleotidyltransferase fold protein [Candidatus Omnitrophota bacterium]
MEKNQYELCVKVLKRLEKVGVLKDVILIGSWCIPFYKEYFAGIKYISAIKTRDVDFLIPNPHGIKVNVNIPELLKDLGFIIGYRGAKGYIKLEHPDLVVEFLSPEKGRGTDKPVPLPKLGVNAVALRFLSLLTDNVIKAKVEDFEVLLPHPANFALHKLIIFQRRFKEDKAIKDRNAAVEILRALINKGDTTLLRHVFNSMLPKWQKKVIAGLEETKEKELLSLLFAK